MQLLQVLFSLINNRDTECGFQGIQTLAGSKIQSLELEKKLVACDT